VPSKSSNIPLEPGDVLCNQSAGGGGYGDPTERDPAMIDQDWRDGFISPATARDVYDRPARFG
jgi:N-methylhydantoinase B